MPIVYNITLRYYIWRMDKDCRNKYLRSYWKAFLEVCFIIFLFYSNLLMGEYNSTGLGRTKGLWWAMCDVFTYENCIIAVVLATIGHLFFDYLKSK